MNYMFETGFLGTRAPFFMDFVTLIVALLPLLTMMIITLAVKKKYKAHAVLQLILFAVSAVVLVYFEIGVRIGGGFDYFIGASSVSHNYALFVLIFHIIIAASTLVVWSYTLLRVKKLLESNTHKKFGRYTFLGIVLTSLTGLWVYLLLFVY